MIFAHTAMAFHLDRWYYLEVLNRKRGDEYMNNQKLFGRGVLLAVVAGLFAAGSVQATSYTNILSGNWTDSTKWNTSGTGVSDAATTIVFKPTAADNSTNNNTGAFTLNQLQVVPNFAVNLYSSGGSSLLFTNADAMITNAGTSTLTINSPITLATNLTVSSASSGAITINSNITESAMSDIIKLGANTLTLTGSNTFSGNIYIKAGTLMDRQSSSGYNGNFGPATSTIYLGDATVGANATLQSGNNGFCCSNPIVVVSGGGTRTIQATPVSGQNPIFGGNITLSNDLQLAYSGRTANNPLIISGNITGTGNITCASTAAGTHIDLIGASINPVGAITNICLATNNFTFIKGAIGTNVTAVVQNSAITPLQLSTANNTCSNLLVSLGTLQFITSGSSSNAVVTVTSSGTNDVQANYAIAGLQDVSGAGGIVLNNNAAAKTLTLVGAGTYSFAGTVKNGTSSLALTQAGIGTQTLSGANSYSGTTTINAGALKLMHSSAVQNSTVTISTNNGLVFGTGITTFNLGNLAGASNQVLTNDDGTAVTLNVGSNNTSAAYSGSLSGVAGGLNKLGTGTLTLTGTNTYTGPTEILGGTLTIGGAGQLGNGDYAGAISNNMALVYGSTANQTLSGVISGTGSLTQQAGVLLLNGVNTYSGETTVSGGTLGGTGTISGPVSASAGSGVLAPSLGTGGSNTLNLASTLTLNSGLNLKFALLPSGTVTNDQIAVSGALTMNGVNYVTLTFPGGAVPAGTYTLMTYNGTNGTGSIALGASYPNATLTYDNTKVTLTVSGGSTSAGSTLTWKGNQSGNWYTGGTANWTNMAGSAVTYSDGNAVTFDQNASRFNVTGTVAAVSPNSVTISNIASAYTIGANIVGSGYLVKNGSGTATLTGTNNYVGPTFVNVGTLTIGGAGQLGDGNYAGVITHNGAALNFASSAPNTISGGIIKGLGAAAPVIASGTGLLTLSGVNSISTLTVSTGTTVIANTTTLSSQATVGSVANSPATLILSNGTVTGITTLTVGNIANANTNGVRVTGGSLLEVNTSITMGNASSTGNYVTNFGGILQFITSTPTITITNYPANALVITNGTVSFRGVDPVNLTNNWVNSGIGTNTVIWQGNNTLRLNGSTATNTLGRPYEFNTGFGPTNYVNLELLGTSFIKGDGVTIGAAGSMLVSNGTATITGALTNNGTVTLAGSPATLMATNGFYNNGLLTGSGTVSGLVTVGSAGTISAGGTGTVGTLTFSTNVVFAGGTNLWTYNAGAGTWDTINILGNISGSCFIKINGSGEIPANAAAFTFSGTNGTPSFTTSEGYAVTGVTSTNVTVSVSSRGYLMIIQ
jgi:autotransporter-associated beta strand protein